MTSGERTNLAARTLGVVRRCAISVASVSAAAGLALVLRHYQLPHPFVAFSSLAIAITFWCAGTWPGVLAMVLSCVAMSEFFFPLHPAGISSESYFIVYGIFSTSVGWFSASRRRAERLLEAERETLEVRVAQRTSELTTVNTELRSSQVELQTEKDRLKLLLDLTNNLVSDLEIQEAVKTAVSNATDHAVGFCRRQLASL